MIIEHKKIELDNKVVFETIISGSPDTFNYYLQDEAYSIYVKTGSHIAITSSEVMEVIEGLQSTNNY